MKALYREIKEELFDFIEDYNDLIRRRPQREDVKQKSAVLRGQLSVVRPAYLFAERVENFLKIVFGISVIASAITSTFVGFSSLSQLVSTLIESIPGRIILAIIGLSYLIIALWKTLHLNSSKDKA